MRTILLLAVTIIGMNCFASEIFVKVLKNGNFYATALNQTQYNSNNTFRFFDLPAGNITLQIVDQNTGQLVLVYPMNLNGNQRVVAELNNYNQLSIVQNITVNYSNWYTENQNNNWNINYPNTQNYTCNFNQNGICNVPLHNHINCNNNQNNNLISNSNFQQFINSLSQSSFDSNKLIEAKNYAKQGNLSANQIAEISKQFSFDSNRLDWAKYAYGKCYDKVNYFVLKNTFAFQSNYKSLEEYIATQI